TGATREARTNVKRCQGVHRTRPASFRLATMSCCRRSAFSATSSTRRRTRSAASPETNRRRSITGRVLHRSARMTFVARTGFQMAASGQVILVVDDHNDTAELIAEMLRMEG